MISYNEFHDRYLAYRIHDADVREDWAILYGMIHAFILLAPEDEAEKARPLREEARRKATGVKEHEQ